MSLEASIQELNATLNKLIASMADLSKITPAAPVAQVQVVSAEVEVESDNQSTEEEAPKRKRRTKAEIEAARAAEVTKTVETVEENVTEKSIFDSAPVQQEEAPADLYFLGDDAPEAAKEEDFEEISLDQLRALARQLTSGANAKMNGDRIVLILGHHGAKNFPELQGDLKKHYSVYKQMKALVKD